MLRDPGSPKRRTEVSSPVKAKRLKPTGPRAAAPTGVEPRTTSDSSIIASSAWRCLAMRSSCRVGGSSSNTMASVTAWPSVVLPIRRSHVGARVSAAAGSGNQRSCSL